MSLSHTLFQAPRATQLITHLGMSTNEHDRLGDLLPHRSAFNDGQSVATDPNGLAPSRMSKFSEAFSGRTNTPNTPARFVLHTDAGELPATNEDEVVELPPQYGSFGGKVNRSPTYREGQTSSGATSSGTRSTPAPPGDQPTGPSS